MTSHIYEYEVEYGYGDGKCNLCESTSTLLYCHRDRINTCDSCLRADFDYERKNCVKCAYKLNCIILHDYSPLFDIDKVH